MPAKKSPTPSSLEIRFSLLWELAGDGSAPCLEYLFCDDLYLDKAGRKRKRGWRFDFAWPAEKVAVEIEGGIFVNGRHSRGMGAVRDADKYNRAAMDGWLILRYTVVHINDRGDEMIEQVRQALIQRRDLSTV